MGWGLWGGGYGAGAMGQGLWNEPMGWCLWARDCGVGPVAVGLVGMGPMGPGLWGGACGGGAYGTRPVEQGV